MAYDKQTWADGSGGGTPLNATRLNHIEDGIEATAITADAASTSIANSDGLATPVDLSSVETNVDGTILSTATDVSGTSLITQTSTSVTVDTALIARDIKASGLTGATTDVRFVGGVASVAPTSGTFLTGDFVISQDAKVIVCTAGGSPGTWSEVGGTGGASDPYGLLSDPAAIAADEFDDGSIHSDWVQVATVSGTIAYNEAFHRLGVRTKSCNDGDTPAIVRPLSTFGGAWNDTTSIVEAQIFNAGPVYTRHTAFIVADGATATSKAAGISVDGPEWSRYLYNTKGVLQQVNSVLYTAIAQLTMGTRLRLVAVDSTHIKPQYSIDGTYWDDFGNYGANITIDFTPTHVGFVFRDAYDTPNLHSIEYVRRIA